MHIFMQILRSNPKLLRCAEIFLLFIIQPTSSLYGTLCCFRTLRTRGPYANHGDLLACQHPQRSTDHAYPRQYYYIILELAPGGELFHQIVRLTYFSEDLSRHVITQVAEALLYLHEEKGVVHR
jgi:serine/threonine protein kinase